MSSLPVPDRGRSLLSGLRSVVQRLERAPIASRHARHEHVVDEVQETFVKLLQKLPTLEVRHGTLQPYLDAMARYVCYDAIRAAGRGPRRGGRFAR